MPRIVIAGGGVAGLEALAALRAHLGAEPVIELVDGAVDLVERQWSVTTPFGGAPPRRFDLAEIARDLGAHLRPDHLLSVDVPARRLRTVRGDVLDFDALLVAVGARHDVAVPGALTFSGPRDVGAFAGLLDDLRGGRVQRVAFAVPAGVAWTLPLYELALMTADELALRASTAAELLLVTPEHEPLEAFGPAVARRVPRAARGARDHGPYRRHAAAHRRPRARARRRRAAACRSGRRPSTARGAVARRAAP